MISMIHLLAIIVIEPKIILKTAGNDNSFYNFVPLK
jgi:hypothetical protein